MEDNLKKGKLKIASKQKWKTTSKKMEDDLKKNGRRPPKNGEKKPYKMEDDLKYK